MFEGVQTEVNDIKDQLDLYLQQLAELKDNQMTLDELCEQYLQADKTGVFTERIKKMPFQLENQSHLFGLTSKLEQFVQYQTS